MFRSLSGTLLYRSILDHVLTVWVVFVVAGAILQIIGVALTVRHVRTRWHSVEDGRRFRAYLMEPAKGWISAKRGLLRWRRRSASELITIEARHGIQFHHSAVVTITPGSLAVETWPNAKHDPEGFAAVVREKLMESNTKIDELRSELAAKDHEIESKTQAEVGAIKEIVEYVADGTRSIRTEGLRTEFSAAVFIGLGVAFATLGGTGLLFWT